MADILIRGMEIPRQGLKVVAIHSNGHVYADTSDPGFLNKIADVIELPEHGDLIDRSKLSFVCGGTTPMEMDYVRRYVVYGMPVIVPANKEGSE